MAAGDSPISSTTAVRLKRAKEIFELKMADAKGPAERAKAKEDYEAMKKSIESRTDSSSRLDACLAKMDALESRIDALPPVARKDAGPPSGGVSSEAKELQSLMSQVHAAKRAWQQEQDPKKKKALNEAFEALEVKAMNHQNSMSEKSGSGLPKMSIETFRRNTR